MKRYALPWTPAEDEQLTAGWQGGLNAVALCELLKNRNLKGVQRRLRVLGLTDNPVRKSWTTRENKHVIAGTAAGHPVWRLPPPFPGGRPSRCASKRTCSGAED